MLLNSRKGKYEKSYFKKILDISKKEKKIEFKKKQALRDELITAVKHKL